MPVLFPKFNYGHNEVLSYLINSDLYPNMPAVFPLLNQDKIPNDESQLSFMFSEYNQVKNNTIQRNDY